jgi:polyhydroxyalkanoate synthesis regulator phasin
MADRSPNLHDNVTPAPTVSSTDTVEAAQAHLNEIAERFVDSGDLSYADRAALVQDIKSAKARVNELKRGQQ